MAAGVGGAGTASTTSFTRSSQNKSTSMSFAISTSPLPRRRWPANGIGP